MDKLTYFFTQFFDHNQDGVIDVRKFVLTANQFKTLKNRKVSQLRFFQSKDFAGLNERLRKVHILILVDFLESITTRAILFTKVAGWELDDPQYLAVCDNNRVFFECLLEQVTIVVSSGAVFYPVTPNITTFEKVYIPQQVIDCSGVCREKH